jgi:hypothetical protein
MPKLPRLTAREIAAVLERIGFSLARQSGSHQIFKNAAGKGSSSRFENPSLEGLEEYSARRGAESRRSGKAAALMLGKPEAAQRG